MKKLFLLSLFVCMLMNINVLAQEVGSNINQTNPPSPTTPYLWQLLDITANPAIENLLKYQFEHGNKFDNSLQSYTTAGYRVQVFSGSGVNAHSQAERIKSDILTSDYGVKVYLIFKSPDFIVKVGDFRAKSDALKLKNSIMNKYPAAFIISDIVLITNTSTTNNN